MSSLVVRREMSHREGLVHEADSPDCFNIVSFKGFGGLPSGQRPL